MLQEKIDPAAPWFAITSMAVVGMISASFLPETLNQKLPVIYLFLLTAIVSIKSRPNLFGIKNRKRFKKQMSLATV